jgi:signal transduction histidine kinase
MTRPTVPEAGRWRRRSGSVRVRVTVAASLVTAIAVSIAGWMLVGSVEEGQISRINDRAEESMDRVVKRLEAGQTVEESLQDLPSTVFVANESGICVASSPAGGGDTLKCGRQKVVAEPLTGGSTKGKDVVPQGVAELPGDPGPTGAGGGNAEDEQVGITSTGAGAVTRRVDSPLYGPVTVTAIAQAGEVAGGVKAVGDVLWVLLAGLVGMVALTAWWLAGQALRPVEAIRVEAEEIGGATMHRRLPEPDSDDEIGRLARTMNAMLERLEDSARRQRQFVSDASHELRSPVAAIRTDLEVALREGARADWPTVANDVLAEERRLEILLGDLLILASDDESAAPLHAGTVDLAVVATEEAGRGRCLPVTLERPAGRDPDVYVVAGVATRLERSLTNLVDNACRHAASEVKVSLSREGRRVRVIVDDDGPGIEPADRERIFERFTRLDDSRARDQGGAGLGLAVVRSIIVRHGGQVWADDSPLGGARFTIELPAAAGRHPRAFA